MKKKHHEVNEVTLTDSFQSAVDLSKSTWSSNLTEALLLIRPLFQIAHLIITRLLEAAVLNIIACNSWNWTTPSCTFLTASSSWANMNKYLSHREEENLPNGSKCTTWKRGLDSWHIESLNLGLVKICLDERKTYQNQDKKTEYCQIELSKWNPHWKN